MGTVWGSPCNTDPTHSCARGGLCSVPFLFSGWSPLGLCCPLISTSLSELGPLKETQQGKGPCAVLGRGMPTGHVTSCSGARARSQLSVLADHSEPCEVLTSARHSGGRRAAAQEGTTAPGQGRDGNSHGHRKRQKRVKGLKTG